MAKYPVRESKQRQRENGQRCTWYLPEGDYCHAPAIRGEKFCKQHRLWIKKWIAGKHKRSYAEQNVVSWGGWSKFDE